MSTPCAGFRDLCWEALDAGREQLPPDLAGHAAACPACAAYAEEARRLHGLLEELARAEESPRASVAAAVLGRVRAERDRLGTGLSGAWIPVQAVCGLAACWALWYFGLWDGVASYLRPDLSVLDSLRAWTGAAASGSAGLPMGGLLALCGLAAALWLVTLVKEASHERE